VNVARVVSPQLVTCSVIAFQSHKIVNPVPPLRARFDGFG
jgi:hypothetical protein